MIQLYYTNNSCSLSVHLALEWAKAEYNATRVDYGSKEIFDVTPKGAVPAMVVDGWETMTQNEALLQYVAHRYPEADLDFAGDIDKTYEIQNVLAIVGGDLHPAFSPMFASAKYTTNTDEKAIEDVKNAAYISIDKQMNFIDTFLEGKEYAVGNKKTIADAYLFTVLRWSCMTPKSVLEYPNIKTYFEKMSADESVIKLLAIHNPEK